jgi:preprotein translocase subunit SecD
MTRTWSAALVALLCAGLLGTACTLPSAPCDLVIAAIDDPDVREIPADAQILATAEDIDPAGWRASDPGVGGGAVDLRLRPAAAERLAAHTTANAGAILAIAVDDVVVSTPVVTSPIMDGALTITGGVDDDIVAAFAPCLPIEIRPPG